MEIAICGELKKDVVRWYSIKAVARKQTDRSSQAGYSKTSGEFEREKASRKNLKKVVDKRLHSVVR